MNAFTLDDNYLSKFVFLLYSVLVAPLFPVLLHQLYRTDSSVVALFSSSFYFIFIFICIDRYRYKIHLEDFKSFVGYFSICEVSSHWVTVVRLQPVLTDYEWCCGCERLGNESTGQNLLVTAQHGCETERWAK